LAKKGEGWEFSKMSLAEKEERLRRFHPSYKEGSLQELKVGSSKGYRLPPEICSILESWSRIDPDRINLSQAAYETDVLIIGGGGAGTAAALLARESGADTLIATKLRHGDANTMMADGGIQVENRLAGNSLLDVLVFGRIAGKNAALYAREKAQDGRLTLNHVRRFHQELKGAGIDRKKISPIVLPDYSNPLVRDRQLTTKYQGTIR
jgi:hypothetical protein